MASNLQYTSDATRIALSLLVELLDALKGYRDHFVLVGGWAPYILLETFSEVSEIDHAGSLDADLAVDYRTVPEDAYESILEILGSLGYQQRTNSKNDPIPASFEKHVELSGGNTFRMQIDFLAGEYGGAAKSKRHQTFQDMLARKARGTDLVFENFYELEKRGTLLNGAELSVSLRVANEVAVFTMKGILLGQRTKPKDFYDLYLLAKRFREGPTSLATSLKPHAGNKLVREALSCVNKYFESPDSLGPNAVADFFGEDDPENREVMKRDAHETLLRVLKELDI